LHDDGKVVRNHMEASAAGALSVLADLIHVLGIHATAMSGEHGERCPDLSQVYVHCLVSGGW